MMIMFIIIIIIIIIMIISHEDNPVKYRIFLAVALMHLVTELDIYIQSM